MADCSLSELYERIGRNIAYLRKSRKLTQQEFANKLHIHSQSLVSQYENAKKPLTFEKVVDFCVFFDVNLEDMLFQDFSNKEKNHSVEQTAERKTYATSPIQKCAGRTYYAYYIKEQNKNSSEFSSRIATFTMNVMHTSLSHEAQVELAFLNDRKERYVVKGILRMDESYAYVICHDLERDFFWELTFFYYRQGKRKFYSGGMALLQTLDYHVLPISQFCILSSNAIASKRLPELKALLQIDFKSSHNRKLSNRCLSSDAILRLTKEKESAVDEWLRQNVNL